MYSLFHEERRLYTRMLQSKATQKCVLVALIIACLCLLYVLYYHSGNFAGGNFFSTYRIVNTVHHDSADNIFNVDHAVVWGDKSDQIAKDIKQQMNEKLTDSGVQWNLGQGYFPSVKKEELLTKNSVHKVHEDNPKIIWKIIENSTSPAKESSIKWIEATGTFLERLEIFNDALSYERHRHISKRTDIAWKDVVKPITVIWGNRDDYIDAIANYSSVITYGLPWVEDGTSEAASSPKNLLVKEYYPWTGSNTMCKWINTKGFTKARYDAVFNRSCQANLTSTYDPKNSLNTVYYWGKPVNPDHYWPYGGYSYPSYFFTTLPKHILYIHFISDAVITQFGDVFTHTLKLVPYSCSQELHRDPPYDYRATPVYDEVFSMAQFWGGGIFHLNIENIPRLAPYLTFLKAHQDIKIHVANVAGLTSATLESFGISSSRLISGITRAVTLYLPQSTPCGFPNPHMLQITSKVHREITEALNPGIRETQPNTIVLIKRSHSRKFTEHQRIEQSLKTIAKEFNFDFTVFADNPVPSHEESMRMFYSAALVVAPHGAGLFNLLFSRPGVFVIEGVCNPPHVNLCYLWSAHILGHRYHAVTSRGGCESYVDADSGEIDSMARIFVKQILKHRTK